MAPQPDRAIIDRYVDEVWQLCLGRSPDPDELEREAAALAAGADPMMFLLRTNASVEAGTRRAERDAVPIAFPPGHYYSPIVDPAALADSGFETNAAADPVLAVALDYARMEELITRALAGWNQALPEKPAEGRRYYTDNDQYCIGDAIVLAAMLRHFRPKRWIEVGCGYSSAILLDTLDGDPSLDTRLTFIEPDTTRLDKLLNRADRRNVAIISGMVQDVPLDVFDQLESGDVLFLDTTHISKTGSDVNHEIFQILPRLAGGVIVHFHDVFDRFEYPREWIYALNRSWNELYILRAFLMYNDAFTVLYANAAFAEQRKHVLERLCPAILSNPGCGLWLVKR